VTQTLVEESGVGTARLADRGAELREDKVHILCRESSLAEENGVAGPRVGVESLDGDGQPGAYRVQMDVAHELEKVRVLFDQNVFEAVLEEVAAAAVDAVEGGGVGAEPALREAGDREVAGTQECVRVLCGALSYVQRVR